MSGERTYTRFLGSRGYLNAETEDWGTLASAPAKARVAYCTSKRCAGLRERVRKDVAGYPDFCPTCGFALVYKLEARGL